MLFGFYWYFAFFFHMSLKRRYHTDTKVWTICFGIMRVYQVCVEYWAIWFVEGLSQKIMQVVSDVKCRKAEA